MIGKIQLLLMAVVLLGSMFFMGGLRPFDHAESYVLTGVPVMIVEITLALVVAPRWVTRVVVDGGNGSWTVRVVRMAMVSLAAVMPPTVMILFVNQALDGSPGVAQMLPVVCTYSSVHRGSTTYYAVVTAVAPERRFFALSGNQKDIELPRASWQTLVPGRSTMTLKVHPGRFGLPWYDIVGTSI